MVKNWKSCQIPAPTYDKILGVQKKLQNQSIGKITIYQAVEIAINTSSILAKVKI